MPKRQPAMAGSAVVLVGSFNPAIFQPSWFQRQNLIPAAEADDAKVKIIHAQISQFETERFVVQVTPDRFIVASTPNAADIMLRDLVMGTFYVLEHTPVTAMGMNRHMHYETGSEEAWHHIGDKLVPKDAWEPLSHGRRAGMLSVEVETWIAEESPIQVRVKVQPSSQVKHGVYFETNEHHESRGDEGLRHLLDVLRDRWEDAQRHASRIADDILNWALA